MRNPNLERPTTKSAAAVVVEAEAVVPEVPVDAAPDQVLAPDVVPAPAPVLAPDVGPVQVPALAPGAVPVPVLHLPPDVGPDQVLRRPPDAGPDRNRKAAKRPDGRRTTSGRSRHVGTCGY